MTDTSRLKLPAPYRSAAESADISFARYLVEQIGVACVPGSSFYNDAREGSSQVRFTFCKREETLAAAEVRFASLHD